MGHMKTSIWGAIAALAIAAAGAGCAELGRPWHKGHRRPAAQAAQAAPQLVIPTPILGTISTMPSRWRWRCTARNSSCWASPPSMAIRNCEHLLDRRFSAVGRNDIPVAAGVPTQHANIFTQAAYAQQAPPRRHPDAVTFLWRKFTPTPAGLRSSASVRWSTCRLPSSATRRPFASSSAW